MDAVDGGKLMSLKTIGTCSLCGGAVVVPTAFHSMNPPIPQCVRCKATPRHAHGPVIEMQPSPQRAATQQGELEAIARLGRIFQ